MTDHHDPQDLDELASAHLDGRTSPEEAARVEADPILQARVEELAAVREAIRSLEPPADPGRREAAIAAALAAFDGAPDATVTSLAAVARRRTSDPRWIRRAAVAAAVALAALAVPLLGSLDSGDDEDTTALREADAPQVVTGDAEAGLDADDGAGAVDQAVTTTVPGLQLGSYESVDQLATAVAGFASGGAAPTAAQSDAGDTGAESEAYRAYSCGSAPPVPDGATTQRSGTATVAGRAVDWALYEEPDGERGLVVRDQATCDVTSTTV